MTTTGLNENIVHSPISNQRNYSYRTKAGIIPSAEYAVYFNDFFESPTSNAVPGTTAVIDVGATLTATATDAVSYNGAVRITSDGTTEGVALYWPKGIQLGLGKKFFMEVRVRTADADDTDVQFGLSDLTATTNPEDVWTTAAANVIAFGVLDGDATPALLCDKDNAGTTVDKPTGTDYDISDSTWHILAIEVAGTATGSNMRCSGYVDGKLAVTFDTETAIPDDIALAPFIGARTGSDANHVIDFDYIRWSIER